MIQWEEIPADDQAKMIEIAKGMAVAAGGSPTGYLSDMLSVIDAEIMRASRIPAHLFEATEKAASRPLPLRHTWR